MKITHYILILIYTLAIQINVIAQNNNASNNLHIQTNNIIYVSGEDIGFKCTFFAEEEHSGSVLFVDICGEGYIISSCILKSENDHWQGKIEIPDSVQTGVYIIRAYIGDKNGNPKLTSKLISILNRFDNNELNEIRKKKKNYQEYNYLKQKIESRGESIKTYANKTNFSILDTIPFYIENKLNESIGGISFSVFKINNENADLKSAKYEYATHQLNSNFKIYNNLTLSGKIIDKTTKTPKYNEMVFLSIPNNCPQINYDFTDMEGTFHFQLDNYHNKQEIIVQTQNKAEELEIVLYPLNLLPPLKIPYYISSDTENHEFSKLAVLRSKMNQAYETKQSIKSIDDHNNYPFYGNTTKLIYPGDFIPLVDFKEIAWEILPLVKYKVDKDSTYLKVWDNTMNKYYDDPMLLVDGVPISKPAKLNNLNSEKIDWIEIQTKIRCYGDLLMKGLVNIQTKSGDFSEIELPENSIRTEIETFYYDNFTSAKGSIFQNVLFWESKLENQNKQQLKVVSSNETGKYIAIAQIFDIYGNLHRSVFHFEVR